MQRIEYDCECSTCKGTGLYAGMAESDGAAVVCSRCGGTGARHIVNEYAPFTGKKITPDIKRVYRVNPGIGIGEGSGCKLEDFGGMPVDLWKAGYDFPDGSEDRLHTCPAWFYQCANDKRKPSWRECAFGMRFYDCEHFGSKSHCWAKWDKEYGGK